MLCRRHEHWVVVAHPSLLADHDDVSGRRPAARQVTARRATRVALPNRLGQNGRQWATGDGEELGEVYIDWGRSGGDSHDESDALAHRPGFRSLLRAVEAGEVSAVFAHRVDRLGRCSHALGRLWATCKQAGTRVITTEGDFSDDDDPATFLMRHTFEGFAVYYLKEQTAKNRRAVAYMKRRGDELGRHRSATSATRRAATAPSTCRRSRPTPRPSRPSWPPPGTRAGTTGRAR